MDQAHSASDRDPPTVRIVIVDDHEILAASLAHVLDAEDDLETVGIAGSLARGLALVAETEPDVVLLDHRLPDGDGVEAIDGLRASHPEVQVVVLTASGGDNVLVSAIENGAAGFVSKTSGVADVRSAVRAAAAGEAVISPEMLARLLPRLRRGQAQGRHTLTTREREVLDLVAEGLTNAAIADRLVVSVHTVRNHIANLSTKLDAHSKLEALSIALREGLLSES